MTTRWSNTIRDQNFKNLYLIVKKFVTFKQSKFYSPNIYNISSLFSNNLIGS